MVRQDDNLMQAHPEKQYFKARQRAAKHSEQIAGNKGDLPKGV
jgi:hypothetical protein